MPVPSVNPVPPGSGRSGESPPGPTGPTGSMGSPGGVFGVFGPVGVRGGGIGSTGGTGSVGPVVVHGVSARRRHSCVFSSGRMCTRVKFLYSGGSSYGCASNSNGEVEIWSHYKASASPHARWHKVVAIRAGRSEGYLSPGKPQWAKPPFKCDAPTNHLARSSQYASLSSRHTKAPQAVVPAPRGERRHALRSCSFWLQHSNPAERVEDQGNRDLLAPFAPLP